jgi:hypothetical protein
VQKKITVESNDFSAIARENMARLIAARLKEQKDKEVERQMGERKVR